jgi:hypothetical protein
VTGTIRPDCAVHFPATLDRYLEKHLPGFGAQPPRADWVDDTAELYQITPTAVWRAVCARILNLPLVPPPAPFSAGL